MGPLNSNQWPIDETHRVSTRHLYLPLLPLRRLINFFYIGRQLSAGRYLETLVLRKTPRVSITSPLVTKDLQPSTHPLSLYFVVALVPANSYLEGKKVGTWRVLKIDPNNSWAGRGVVAVVEVEVTTSTMMDGCSFSSRKFEVGFFGLFNIGA